MIPATFEIKGYHVVLPCVQNVYPAEKYEFYYEWGFKYISGVFEFFSYKTKKEAQKAYDDFVLALNLYWSS